eukprot:4725875-Prymnesium_polylepis.1
MHNGKCTGYCDWRRLENWTMSRADLEWPCRMPTDGLGFGGTADASVSRALTVGDPSPTGRRLGQPVDIDRPPPPPGDPSNRARPRRRWLLWDVAAGLDPEVLRGWKPNHSNAVLNYSFEPL